MATRKKAPFFSVTDFLLISPIMALAAWVYLIPPFQTFGYHTLFSDDAIFAMMARKALEDGPRGAYHLSWGPLLPWFIALLNKFFNIPLEEGGRIITGISLFLRIIPFYLLAKYLFNRFAAFIAVYLITVYTFLTIPQEAALAEGLFSLIVFTGLLFSFLALKTERLSWYFLSGFTGGLAYLARLEGWVFLTSLFLLTGLKAVTLKKQRFLVFKPLLILVFLFLLVASPYLIFIREAFGSWNLNPRMNIVLTAGANYFDPYIDNNGTTTIAQVYFSGDPKYYNSNLWHPTPYLFWRSLGRSWGTVSTIPTLYFDLFSKQASLLLVLGFLGLFLTLYNTFRNRLSLLLTTIALLALCLYLLDFSLISLEFLSPVIFNPEGNLNLVFNQFLKMLLLKDYQSWAIRDTTIIAATALFIITRKENLLKLAQHLYLQRLNIYLPLSLLLGFIPLLFSGFAVKYAMVTGAILALLTGFFVSSLSSVLVKTTRKICPPLPIIHIAVVIQILVLFSIFWTSKPQFDQILVDTREAQHKLQAYQVSWLKNPGLAILKDHARPGAKVATFYEAPAFYAQGIPFYVMTGSNIPLEQTLSYLEKNKVDYLYLDKTQGFLIHKSLQPLLRGESKSPNWKMIYSDPPQEKAWLNESNPDILVTVYKRLD